MVKKVTKKKTKVNYAKMFQEIKGHVTKGISYIPGSNRVGKNKVKQERIYVCPRCSSTDTKINAGKQFVCNGCFLVMKVK
jgi:Zn finger protein HypA/HybF involved in hydrogenase expression